jgi:hypothetical protein
MHKHTAQFVIDTAYNRAAGSASEVMERELSGALLPRVKAKLDAMLVEYHGDLDSTMEAAVEKLMAAEMDLRRRIGVNYEAINALRHADNIQMNAVTARYFLTLLAHTYQHLVECSTFRQLAEGITDAMDDDDDDEEDDDG